MSQQRPERPRTIVPPPVPPRPSRRFVEYLIGLALGAIPMVLLLLAIGGLASQFSGTFFSWAIGLYILSIVAALVCLANRPTRFIGYGLLTMVFVTPIVYYVSCVASIRANCMRYCG
ncbi:MAG TPA: hypothetical protein VN729_06670 [Ktedonobacteraceae bacterium]|nr:hypothetical protein [Ktedonobacteraceae bacterium]